MKRGFQIFLWTFGGTVMLIALAHVVWGPAAIPGAQAVSATMDSEDRFYAVFFGAYGLLVARSAIRVEHNTALIRALAATFFVGGLARLVSIVAVGLPHPFFLAMTALELVIPVAMMFVQRRIAETAPA